MILHLKFEEFVSAPNFAVYVSCKSGGFRFLRFALDRCVLLSKGSHCTTIFCSHACQHTRRRRHECGFIRALWIQVGAATGMSRSAGPGVIDDKSAVLVLFSRTQSWETGPSKDPGVGIYVIKGLNTSLVACAGEVVAAHAISDAC